MRRPYLAVGQKRKLTRLRALKKGSGKQISRRPHRVSPDAPAPRNDSVELAAREPMRCSFGAVRAGALLGRLRLHLQTERFLSVHRSDAVWEAGCLQASLALAEIVSRMSEEELSAALTSSSAASSRSSGTLRRTTTPNLWSSGGRTARHSGVGVAADASSVGHDQVTR